MYSGKIAVPPGGGGIRENETELYQKRLKIKYRKYCWRFNLL
jgi:hypothetical protein